MSDDRSYLMCEPFHAYNVLAGTSLRWRQSVPFNFSSTHAASPDAYAQTLHAWLDDCAMRRLYDQNRVFFLHMVHGNHIFPVDDAAVQSHCSRTFIPACDGLVTSLHGESRVVLTVTTADCVPVFLFDPPTRTSALLHCGWRGAAQQIVSKGLHKMMTEYGCAASDILLTIGPCIRKARYEVGPEVAVLFPQAASESNGTYWLDLAYEVTRQAREAGLAMQHIFDCGYCTYDCPDLLFSYRRDGRGTSMVSFISVL